MGENAIEKEQIIGRSVKCSPNNFTLKLLLECMPVIHHNVPPCEETFWDHLRWQAIAFHFGWVEEGGLTSCEKTLKFNNTTELSHYLKIPKTYFYDFLFDSGPFVLIKIIY